MGDASVPVLVEQIHDWAKNGRRLNGKPVKRLEHLSRIRNEFDGTSQESGIKASMRNELVAVKEVLQLKLTLNARPIVPRGTGVTDIGAAESSGLSSMQVR